MEKLIRAIGRIPRQRTTLYGDVAADRRAAGFNAGELAPIVLTAPKQRRRAGAAG